MKLYLAGASREHQRVADVAESLRAVGCYEITERWWDTAPEWSGNDHKLDVIEAQEIARRQLRAIWSSDVVWVLWPEHTDFSGAYVELGIALSARSIRPHQRIAVSGTHVARTLFTSTADFRSHADDMAFSVVARWGTGPSL